MGRLVLSVKPEEQVVVELGGGVTGTVGLETGRDGSPRLVFAFPPEVGIWRGEVWERRQAEQLGGAA